METVRLVCSDTLIEDLQNSISPRFLRGAFLWGPRKFLICGESGGIGRLNDDGGISQCDPIAERESPKLFLILLVISGNGFLEVHR